MQQARDLFSVLELIPDEPWGAGWALDIVAVALRSYGFALLADEEQLEFSFKAVLRGFVMAGRIRADQVPMLGRLRLWKASYRRNRLVTMPAASVRQVVRLAGRCIGAELDCRIVSEDEFRHHTESRLWKSQNWYREARAVEAICLVRGVQVTADVLKELREPSGYFGQRLRYRLPLLMDSLLAA